MQSSCHAHMHCGTAFKLTSHPGRSSSSAISHQFSRGQAAPRAAVTVSIQAAAVTDSRAETSAKSSKLGSELWQSFSKKCSGEWEARAPCQSAWCMKQGAKHHLTCAGRDSLFLWHRRGSGAACSGGRAAQHALAVGLQVCRDLLLASEACTTHLHCYEVILQT